MFLTGEPIFWQQQQDRIFQVKLFYLVAYSDNMTLTSQEAYNELAFYTLSHPSPSFIHQHMVDAFTIQSAGKNSKPIAIFFALAGLYLFSEKQFTGKQVQQVHMQMTHHKIAWPVITLPENRGNITIQQVLQYPAGAERDQAIYEWCRDIWAHCLFLQDTITATIAKTGVFIR